MPLYNKYGELSFHFGPVKDQHMGFCVGTDGSTLKTITEKTGAKIKIMKADSDHPDPWFLITGNFNQLKWARNWLNAVRKEAIERIPLQNDEAGAEVYTREEVFDDPEIPSVDFGYSVDISNPYFQRVKGTTYTLRNISFNEIVEGLKEDKIALHEIINCPRNIQVAYFSGCSPNELSERFSKCIGVISSKFGILESTAYSLVHGADQLKFEAVVRVYYNSDIISYTTLMKQYLRNIETNRHPDSRLPNVIFLNKCVNDLLVDEKILISNIMKLGTVEFRGINLFNWFNY